MIAPCESTDMPQPRISTLCPELPLRDSTRVKAIVTLIWPYSSSARHFALLLAEPDFRLRRRKGQVRARFEGSSAKALATTGVGIGDEVVLSLEGAQFVQDRMVSTPGKSIDWELLFTHTVLVNVFRHGKEMANLHMINVAPTPISRSPVRQTTHRLSSESTHQWSSPAFAKRVPLSENLFFEPPYHPLADEVEDEDGHDQKRRKNSYRDWKAWTYSKKTPSPEKEDVNIDNGFYTIESTPSQPAQAPSAPLSVEDVEERSKPNNTRALRSRRTNTGLELSIHEAENDELYARLDEPSPYNEILANERDTEVNVDDDEVTSKKPTEDAQVYSDVNIEFYEIEPVSSASEVPIVATEPELDRRESQLTGIYTHEDINQNIEGPREEAVMSPALDIGQLPTTVMPPPTLTALQTNFPTTTILSPPMPIGVVPASPTLQPLDPATLPLPSPFPGERKTDASSSFLDYVAAKCKPAPTVMERIENQEIPADADYILDTSFFSSTNNSFASMPHPDHVSVFTPLRFTFGMDYMDINQAVDVIPVHEQVEHTVSDENSDDHVEALLDLSQDEAILPLETDLTLISSVRVESILRQREKLSLEQANQDMASTKKSIVIGSSSDAEEFDEESEEESEEEEGEAVEEGEGKEGESEFDEEVEPGNSEVESDDTDEDSHSVDVIGHENHAVSEHDRVYSPESERADEIPHTASNHVTSKRDDFQKSSEPAQEYVTVDIVSSPIDERRGNGLAAEELIGHCVQAVAETSIQHTVIEVQRSPTRHSRHVSFEIRDEISQASLIAVKLLQRNGTHTTDFEEVPDERLPLHISDVIIDDLLMHEREMKGKTQVDRRTSVQSDAHDHQDSHAAHDENVITTAGRNDRLVDDEVVSPSQFGLAQSIRSRTKNVEPVAEEEGFVSKRGTRSARHKASISSLASADAPTPRTRSRQTTPLPRDTSPSSPRSIRSQLEPHSPAQKDRLATTPSPQTPRKRVSQRSLEAETEAVLPTSQRSGRKRSGSTQQESISPSLPSPRVIRRIQRQSSTEVSELKTFEPKATKEMTSKSLDVLDRPAHFGESGNHQARVFTPSPSSSINENVANRHLAGQYYFPQDSMLITPETTQQAPATSQSDFHAEQYRQDLPMTPQLTQSFSAGLMSSQKTAQEGELAVKTPPKMPADAETTSPKDDNRITVPGTDESMASKTKSPSLGLSTPIAYYTPLEDLPCFLNRSSQHHSSANPDVLALVTSSTTPTRCAPKGPRHHYTTLHITDPSTWPCSVSVNVFRPYHPALPVADTGDIVLLRAFAVQSVNRSASLRSGDESSWCVWRYGKPVWGTHRGAFGEVRAREEVRGPAVERGQGEWAEVEKLRLWYQDKVKSELQEKDEGKRMTRSRDKKALSD